ncbi:MaoC family dehydratase N-terminal domain-containing protein [Terasakiella sp. SH-1]|uniref:FAS1-like dehydratase domain-containing protein n=1 Tax=Terasakiella sp. SH-1 TaxID=2560057 RepID=UPI001073B548|nr:MaoC family dehydratase N-terminal domain-containing protein [Terasakiella sp. SH-1]
MVSQNKSINIDHLSSWIGREENVSDVISLDLVNKFRATIGLPMQDTAVGQAVPRLLHFCLAQPVLPADMLGGDGHPKKGGFLPPVPLPRRMWAGGSLEFNGDLRVGDTVTRKSTIADLKVKEGRTGTLCFVTVDHNVMVGEQSILSERQNIVYREEDTGTSAKKELPVAENGQHQRMIVPTSTLLFRYSALTFNGHRIHYDRPYAIEVEGYDGLVVHGPLQATMMLHFAAELYGKEPDKFTFRGATPLVDNEPFYLHAREENGKMQLWTARKNGPIAMMGEAEWH